MSSPDRLPTENKREPLIDTLVDEKEKTLKIVAEMPGVEKKDVSVVVGDDKVIHIDAERGEKNYHVKVPNQAQSRCRISQGHIQERHTLNWCSS